MSFVKGVMSDDLGQIERLLREQRPRLTVLEEDELRSRVWARAQRPVAGSRPGGIMRTRLAITTTLVMGLLMSGTGAGLAVSGISGDGSAGTAQYPQQVAPDEQPSGDVLGDEPTSGGEEPGNENGGAPGDESQPTRQVAAPDDDSLPFTGLAAIPLLLAGVGLLGFGIVLRRGARSEPAQ
jgi:hypothetical protein